MKTRPCVFNGFLALALVVFVVACSTSEERKRKKEMSSLRIHVESDPGSSDRASAISVHRAAPVLLNIDREAVLDESEVEVAAVTGQPGGLFSVEIKFTRRGGWILERTTVASRGKHLAIFSQFGDQARWLAAPLITAKNSGGRLVFTPDATREEAERFVRGLNNVAKKLERRENWPFRGPLDK
jgi:hypothetical protein